MNGQKRILELRKQNVRPTIVWVNDTAGHVPDPEAKAISIAVHGDTPEACDFRCLNGVENVLIEGVDVDRIERFTAALRYHAGRVVSTQFAGENDPTIVRVIDSAEVLTWPK